MMWRTQQGLKADLVQAEAVRARSPVKEGSQAGQERGADQGDVIDHSVRAYSQYGGSAAWSLGRSRSDSTVAGEGNSNAGGSRWHRSTDAVNRAGQMVGRTVTGAEKRAAVT